MINEKNMSMQKMMYKTNSLHAWTYKGSSINNQAILNNKNFDKFSAIWSIYLPKCFLKQQIKTAHLVKHNILIKWT